MRHGFLFGPSSSLIIGIIAAWTGALPVQTIAAEEQRREPILIPGVQEPEEMRVEPFPINNVVPTAPERMLGEALESADKNDLAALLPALNQILAKYPDYSDAYIVRLGALCGDNDRVAIVSSIDSALKFIGTSRIGKESLGSLLSMRAKLEHTNADDRAAMDDLDNAIHADLANATKFANSGGVAPEKTASVCTWTQPDMDALVRRFPADYRSYLFRGLYYGHFAQFDQESLKPAIDNLMKSAELNPLSALSHFFNAEILSDHLIFYKRLSELGWSDAAREKLLNELLDEFDKALFLDPDLLPALEGRAQARFDLKQFEKAIADYDKTLSLNPQDAVAYNDRGLAKLQLGRNDEAISDFSAAIKIKKRELLKPSSYENRADAYMKTQQWGLAIHDLTTAISLQIGGMVLISNINQFRALYPEYQTVADEAIARKLNQTFYPDMKLEAFSESFLHGRAMGSTVIPDLFLKRSDAYLKTGNWHLASLDFRRAVNGFPAYADVVDRWREIGQTADARSYIDMKTFDDAHSGAIKLWIKQAWGTSEAIGPYTLQQFELNCGARQIRTVSFTYYDASGELTSSRQGSRWESIIPESFGETLNTHACRSN